MATVARAWAARDEFWLDEIWSLMAFTRVPHAWRDVFTFHHDNNHYLVTLWMDLVGPGRGDWLIYRLPSLLASVGTVILAARVAVRWGRTAMFIAAMCTASSFVLILYGSEARGYALCGFFSLVAFLALDRHLKTNDAWATAGFGIATILGILSHLTFVQFYAGAFVWSAVVLIKITHNVASAAAAFLPFAHRTAAVFRRLVRARRAGDANRRRRRLSHAGCDRQRAGSGRRMLRRTTYAGHAGR